MGARTAYWKHLKLGDAMEPGREGIREVIKTVEWQRSPWADRATPNEKRPSSYLSIEVAVKFIRGFTQPETYGEFDGRIYDFVTAFRAAASTQQQTSFTTSGDLVIVESADDHITTTDAAETAGEAVGIEHPGTVTFAVGDLLYVSDGVSAWEVTQVISTDSSTVVNANLANSYPAGATLAKVHAHVAQAYVGELQIPGNDSRDHSVRKGITARFESAETIAHLLEEASWLVAENDDFLLQEDSNLLEVQ